MTVKLKRINIVEQHIDHQPYKPISSTQLGGMFLGSAQSEGHSPDDVG
jgi:hypothetical protein